MGVRVTVVARFFRRSQCCPQAINRRNTRIRVFKACLNNRWQSLLWSFKEKGFFMFLLTLADHFENKIRGEIDDSMIAERALSHSLSTRLITLYSVT